MKRIILLVGVGLLFLGCTPKGSIEVLSTPEGAEVILDDESTGLDTPCVLDKVEEGEHKVALHLEGYSMWIETVQVTKNSTVTIQAILGEPGKLKYKVDMSGGFGTVSGCPAIDEYGTAYVGSWDNRFYAVAYQGEVEWSYEAGSVIHSSSALGSDGTLYFGSYDDQVYALGSDGSLKWKFATSSDVHSSPALDENGTVYVGARIRRLVTQELVDCVVAINPDGTQKAKYEITEEGDLMESSPALGPDKTVYIGANDGYLYALNPNLELKWRYQTGAAINSSPAVGADGTVYFGSDDGSVYALSPSGDLKWSYATGAGVESSPAIGADGVIYVGSNDGKLYALSQSGSLEWSYDVGRSVKSSPALAADGTVYFGAQFGNLYALNSSGELKWVFETLQSVESSPAIGADGTVYFGCSDGFFYAVYGDFPLATSAWPKFGRDAKNTRRAEQ